MVSSGLDVLVVEDDADLNELIGAYIGMAGLSCRSALTGTDAIREIDRKTPAAVVLDLMLPDMSGFDICQRIKCTPACSTTRVIILTTFARAGYLRRALEAGASGYLLKDMRSEELAEAVRRVQQGLRVIDPELATEAWADPDPLTDRERQVLRLAGDGVTSCDIAAELSLSEGTVRNYLSEAISKLGANNRIEAARIARTKGWL